jgi:hypothetical protein
MKVLCPSVSIYLETNEQISVKHDTGTQQQQLMGKLHVSHIDPTEP